jgi:hypothetical protein
MSEYEGTFDIWFEGTTYSETKTRIKVEHWTTGYWFVIVPIGDEDSGWNVALRAALEFIEQHWYGKAILSTVAAVMNNELRITVKSIASPQHKKSYTLMVEEVYL